MVEFDWHDENRAHIAVHGVSCVEAEQVINNDPFDLELQVRNDEERFLQVGETAAGRILIVVSTWRRGTVVRVITAFDAPKAMKLAYIAQKGSMYGRETDDS